MTSGLKKQEIRGFLEQVISLSKKEEKEFADAVLQVVAKANWQVIEELRGDESMCQALLELMEPEINKIKESVREETTQQGIKNAITALKNSGHTNDAIKNFLVMAYSITQSEAEKYL